mmetsp:Transcript_12397/g.37118  ORF Transcript_12397/g.37118 Transcript_12397/m.37118 type:complete len:118 (-) Transcript_12397:226-579(-)
MGRVQDLQSSSCLLRLAREMDPEGRVYFVQQGIKARRKFTELEARLAQVRASAAAEPAHSVDAPREAEPSDAVDGDEEEGDEEVEGEYEEKDGNQVGDDEARDRSSPPLTPPASLVH